MIVDFLSYLESEPGILVFIVAFGIIPLAIVIYLVDTLLKAIGLRVFAEKMGTLFALPIGVTWLAGFVLSMLFFASGVSSLKVLFILIGLFIICLIYSALNFNEMTGFIGEKSNSLQKLKKKG